MATPKDKINRNTRGLFKLESGIPNNEYSMENTARGKGAVPQDVPQPSPPAGSACANSISAQTKSPLK